MNRRRRFSRLALLLGLAGVALTTLVIHRAGAESRAPAELASGQWQRLTQRITRTAEQVRTPHSGAVADIVSESHAASPAATRPDHPAGDPGRAAIAFDRAFALI